MTVTLSDFHILRPKWEYSQEDILSWIAEAHVQSEQGRKRLEQESPPISQFAQEIRERLFKLGTGEGKIQKRSFQLPDLSHREWEKMHIYPVVSSPQGANLKARSSFFSSATADVFNHFYPADTTAPPSHLIHVTCTGYAAPSGAQRIVAQRNWCEHTTVTHAYHMGCYASIPALRMACGFLHTMPSSEARVDVVHTELCSLHLNPSLHTKEQCVIQSLFADGFIKYSLQLGPKEQAFKILALHEETVPNSTSAMSWVCEDFGYQMTISKEVPVLIARSLPGFLERLIKKAQLSSDTIKQKAHFAIHPGGPKIIQHVAQILGLQDFQIQESRWVLENCGNMSSATLPHVWERSIDQAPFLISLAYGPGLTISGALFSC